MDENKKTGPRDVFMHLLSIIFLYTSVITFGTLLFDYIDMYFPDQLQLTGFGAFSRSAVRWPISILVIVFPLYVWLSWYLSREVFRNPEKRELKTRRWLMYGTLFLAAIVIVIDLVTLIYQFLNGELTAHFILKVLAVLGIAITVFVYYIWSVRKDIPATRHPTMKLFVWAVVALAGAFIIAGFFVAGSPGEERMRRFDDERVSALVGIQYQITDYWRTKGALPDSLDNLKDDITGYQPPRDPETGKPYEYYKTGDLSFSLCATFKTSSKSSASALSPAPAVPYGIRGNFEHDAGHTCFPRTIDPDRFPTKPRVQ